MAIPIDGKGPDGTDRLTGARSLGAQGTLDQWNGCGWMDEWHGTVFCVRHSDLSTRNSDLTSTSMDLTYLTNLTAEQWIVVPVVAKCMSPKDETDYGSSDRRDSLFYPGTIGKPILHFKLVASTYWKSSGQVWHLRRCFFAAFRPRTALGPHWEACTFTQRNAENHAEWASNSGLNSRKLGMHLATVCMCAVPVISE